MRARSFSTVEPRARPTTTAMAVALACVGLVVVLARGHAAEGEDASNFRARVLSVTPEVPGLDVAVIENGNRIEVTNATGEDVVVSGYQEEPYLRLGRDGVGVNLRSAATYVNQDRQGATEVPGSVDPTAEPEWSRIGGGGTARWHDHRVHWMGDGDPPAVREDPGRRHTVIPDWIVELRVGDTTVEARGELVWIPAPSTTPWWVVAVVAFAVAAVAALSRTWRPALAAAVVVLVLADVVHVLGLELAGVGGTGSALARVVTDGAISVVGWGAGVLAAALLVGGDDVRRHEAGALVAALVGLLIGAYGGLVEWGDVGRSQVLFAWPGFVFRLATALSLGVGFGIAAGVAGRALRRATRGQRVLTTESAG